MLGNAIVFPIPAPEGAGFYGSTDKYYNDYKVENMDRYSLELFGYPSVNIKGGWVRYDDVTPLLSKIEELNKTAEVTDKAIDLVYADNDLSIIRHTKKNRRTGY